ncbi:MAG: RagB/SusD family nutrient uptake outer membrane protein [Bacteroidales bacterium]|jgi:hypothetical protein
MKTIYNKNILIAVAAFGIVAFSSCIHDLDVTPIDPKVVVADKVYVDADAYRSVLAKCYAGYAVSGQEGPAGNADISGLDEGFGQYLRGYFYHQEFTTDEAIIGWNDGTLYDFHNMAWSASDGFIGAFYSRVFYQISLCNEFIRESSDDKVKERGINDAATIKMYNNEVRFLRALSYYHAIECFGNVPFVTEENKVGGDLPQQISRADLFNYVESELLAIAPQMAAPRANEYGRADRAAAWMLLARLYLNAEVFTGTSRWSDCRKYCEDIINAGYTLEPKYDYLFLADNDLCKDTETIFAINFDSENTTTYGGMDFIIFAEVGGKMDAASMGITSGWGGYRTTPQFVDKFDIEKDSRAMFFISGQTKDVKELGEFKYGYAFEKFKNVKRDGKTQSGISEAYVSTDFPMFRLADAYLMYAECAVRGSGDKTIALGYVNLLRQRAYGNISGNIAAYDLTLDFILDERGRELYLECVRRTDLIRFNKFTTDSYIWAWKGGSIDGTSVDSFRNLFPIPSSDITANPNLKQNAGY